MYGRIQLVLFAAVPSGTEQSRQRSRRHHPRTKKQPDTRYTHRLPLGDPRVHSLETAVDLGLALGTFPLALVALEELATVGVNRLVLLGLVLADPVDDRSRRPLHGHRLNGVDGRRRKEVSRVQLQQLLLSAARDPCRAPRAVRPACQLSPRRIRSSDSMCETSGEVMRLPAHRPSHDSPAQSVEHAATLREAEEDTSMRDKVLLFR